MRAKEYYGKTSVELTYDKLKQCIDIIDDPSLEFYYESFQSQKSIIRFIATEKYDRISADYKANQIFSLFGSPPMYVSTKSMHSRASSTKIVSILLGDMSVKLSSDIVTQELYDAFYRSDQHGYISVKFEVSESKVWISALTRTWCLHFYGSNIDPSIARSLAVMFSIRRTFTYKIEESLTFNLDTLTLESFDFQFDCAKHLVLFVQSLATNPKLQEPGVLYELLKSAETSKELLLMLV